MFAALTSISASFGPREYVIDFLKLNAERPHWPRTSVNVTSYYKMRPRIVNAQQKHPLLAASVCEEVPSAVELMLVKRETEEFALA